MMNAITCATLPEDLLLAYKRETILKTRIMFDKWYLDRKLFGQEEGKIYRENLDCIFKIMDEMNQEERS